MTMPLGSQTIVLGKTGIFNAPTTGLKGLIIGNESPYTLLVVVGLAQAKTLYPETVDFFSTGQGFNGNVTYVPSGVLTNPTSYTASTITFDAVGTDENINTATFPLSLTRQAVSSTATGAPLFSATFGWGPSAQSKQFLNIFNPANSGAIMTFYSARALTAETTHPRAVIRLLLGADLNLTNSVSIVSHTTQSPIPISVGHATSVEQAADIVASTSEVESLDFSSTPEQQDFFLFPDNFVLYPGNNLFIAMVSSNTGNNVRLTLKWSENVLTPPIAVTGAKAVASSIQNDGNVAATQWLEITPSGQGSSAIVSTVDGQLTWKVVQAGVYHQIFKAQSSNNPLQLGQAGDITEILGQLTVDQLTTLVGNLIANGGMNISTIRDNTTGATQVTLLTAGITITNPLNAVLKSLGGGHTLTDWNIGFNAIVTTGTVISHGIKNASGVATAPTAVFMEVGSVVLTTHDVTGINTTQFTATCGANCNVFWVAILL